MFRLSLRTLLLLVALVAAAILSLVYASDAWQRVVWAIALVALVAAAIIAAVDRGPRQSFAIGFTVAMLIYGGVVALFGPIGGPLFENPEFNPSTGRLLTTRLLQPVFSAIADVRHYDIMTHQPVPPNDPRVSGAGAGSQNISLSESPSRLTFMEIGHAWWALVLGACGGLFALWVHARRAREVAR